MSMPCRSLFRPTALLAFAPILFSSPSVASENLPFARGSFASARLMAGKTGRIVLVDFYTTWCGPCKMLDETTWKDKQVRLWLKKHTVSRKIDAEKEIALSDKYKIRAYPTILLLKPDGTEIDRLIGLREPKTFLAEVKQALAGQGSIARAKAKLVGKGKSEPFLRLDYARALAEKGHNAEALKEYLWCLDEGLKYDQSFIGVRGSFMLSDIQRLGEEYPPALDALKQRRDKARVALEKGSTNREIADDFASYNQTLEQPEQTLALYDALKSKNPTAVSTMYRFVFDLLLDEKRYADLIAGSGVAEAYVIQQIESNKNVEKIIKSFKDKDDSVKQGMEYSRQAMVKTCAGLYEALLGTDQPEEANLIRDKVLAYDHSMTTFAELMRHATRADKPEAVKGLKETAKTRLSPTDYARFEKAALDTHAL